MGTVKVTNIEPIADNGTVTLGGSGDTITLGSGATVTGTGLVGITVADNWRLTANTNNGNDGDVTSNWERNDTTSYGSIGTGLTESSGIFSFPSTGKYFIIFNGVLTIINGDGFAEISLFATTDNSTYNRVAIANAGNRDSGGSSGGSIVNTFIFDVTDTSTHKIKFNTSSFSSGTVLMGSTTYNQTNFTVIRIGDT